MSKKENTLNNNNNPKRNSKLIKKIILINLLLILFFSIISIYGYLNSYYKVNHVGYYLYGPTDSMTKSIDEKGNSEFKLNNSKNNIGFIFYPGGKVDEKAYFDVASFLAYQDITTYVTPMPFHLAVFNPNAAEYIINNHPEIKIWYIGGHSLGGSMAASYASKNQDKISGIILLGSYSTEDLNELPVLSIYGSNDTVLNLENYNKYKTNISSNLIEKIIYGGNHAGFANYGPQKGDGKSNLKPHEQFNITTNFIKEFILNNNDNDNNSNNN